jgi:GPI mannosyltransferase 1 subunit X
VDNDCQFGAAVLEVRPTDTVKWLIPCGDEAHTTIVSSFTFLSALICALSIVVSSIFYRPTIYNKEQ